MNCHDPLLLAVTLARYLLALLSGASVDLVYQALRSVATYCVEGPLG